MNPLSGFWRITVFSKEPTAEELNAKAEAEEEMAAELERTLQAKQRLMTAKATCRQLRRDIEKVSTGNGNTAAAPPKVPVAKAGKRVV